MLDFFIVLLEDDVILKEIVIKKSILVIGSHIFTQKRVPPKKELKNFLTLFSSISTLTSFFCLRLFTPQYWKLRLRPVELFLC